MSEVRDGGRGRPPAWRTAAAAALAMLALAACGAAGGDGTADDGAADDPSTPATQAAGEWVLTGGTGPDGAIEVVEDTEVTLTIDEETWGGQVCNHYGAQQVEVDDDGAVTLGGVVRTEMACLDDRVMTLEDRYLAAFSVVDHVEVDDDQLRLTGPDTELRYAPVPPVEAADLVGTVWVLDTVLRGSGPDGSASSVLGEVATLQLGRDGTVTTGSGCLTRTGRVEVGEDRLRVDLDPGGGCQEPDLAAQDEHVWRVLEGAPSATVDGARLTLTAGEDGLSYTADG